MGRVSELIRTILVDLLQTQFNDPRLDGVTITQVTVTSDTTRADVYYTVLGGEEVRETAQQGLESAAGRLQRDELSRFASVACAGRLARRRRRPGS